MNVHRIFIYNGNNLKRSPNPLIDEWINPLWYGHIMQYYSEGKRNNLLINVTTWVNLQMTMLCERSWEKITPCRIPSPSKSRECTLNYNNDRKQLVAWVQWWSWEGGRQGLQIRVGEGTWNLWICSSSWLW